MIRAKFNPKPLQQKLQNRVRGLKATLPEQLHRAGRIVAVSLATSSVPYGLGEDARKLGEAATASQIRRCYATPGQVFEAFPNKGSAQVFWFHLKAGRYSQAQSVMQKLCPKFASKEIKPFDGGEAHRNARNARGRVSKKQEPVFVVQTTRDLTAYVNKEVDRVGEGKAGWGACAKALGGTAGLPQWVTRHAGKLSLGLVEENQSNPQRPFIRMTNQVPYAKNILSETDKQVALRIGLDRLGRAIFNEQLHIARANALS
jgi:hypothetical protein